MLSSVPYPSSDLIATTWMDTGSCSTIFAPLDIKPPWETSRMKLYSTYQWLTVAEAILPTPHTPDIMQIQEQSP